MAGRLDHHQARESGRRDLEFAGVSQEGCEPGGDGVHVFFLSFSFLLTSPRQACPSMSPIKEREAFMDPEPSRWAGCPCS